MQESQNTPVRANSENRLASGFDPHAVVPIKPLLRLIAIGAALRALWALIVPVRLASDANAYHAFAQTMAEHGVFGWTATEPLAFWPPGATFLHAAIYKLVGPHPIAIVVANILMYALLTLLVARISARFYGSRTGLFAAAVMTAWPTFLMYPTLLVSEIPYLVVTMLALDVWTSPRRNLWLTAILAGLLLGYAALIRPLALPLPVLFAVTMFFQQGFGKRLLIRQVQICVICLVIMAAVIAPWTYRNNQLLGEPVPISTNGSVVLWMGNAPGTNGIFMAPPPEIDSLPENERAEILGNMAREYIKEEPVAFLKRSIWKLFLLYRNESIGVAWNEQGISESLGSGMITPLKRLTQAGWALIMLLAIVGLVAVTRRQGLIIAFTSPIVVSIAFYSAVHSITIASDRYHLAFAAQMGALAGAGLLTAMSSLWLNRKSQVRTT